MDILAQIIEEYIKTAQPVGSKALVAKYKIKKSPATIRALMNKLEKRGLLTHLHTSAGRIPTEQGYRFYVGNFLKEKKMLLPKFPEQKKEPWELWIKNIAKKIAEFSQTSVIIAFEPENTYYTGLSYLFSQPEFKNLELISNVSRVVDHLDEKIKVLFKKVKIGVKILIGKKSSFGQDISTIVGAVQTPSRPKILIILLGPMRMDYKKNFAIMKYALSKISSKDA